MRSCKLMALILCLVTSSPFWLTAGQLWAGNITVDQARQQAQAFVNSRHSSGGGALHMPGTQRQLTLAKQVSGLYVFNVSSNGGFVVVANDDSATPILGYSDSGAFVTDSIPDNMRAWLQGYADEIAWAKEHQTKVAATGSHPSSSAPRTQRAPKAAVAPMLTTTWDQWAPFNYQAPYYHFNGYDYDYIFNPYNLEDYEHCPTGCVATAMAQVMYYYKWPQSETVSIPDYFWNNARMLISGLPATTFSWIFMKDHYTGNESEDDRHAAAVAKLMKYCGWSVQMDYGPESGSHSILAANALKAYFDYNSTTTYVQRSLYSYANWIELIYHEVANGRPVIYGGSSTSGGHDFVCDGYEGEDYFHINWGWGGSHDSYFKLSALDPEVEGVGGGNSTEGFHFQQDAIIGIQPSTGTGTVADVPTNTISLELNSVSVSSHPTQGEEVTVYVDLKNNSSDDYDGDIGICIYLTEGQTKYYVEDVYNNFLIPANAPSTTCELTFTPYYSGSYQVRVFSPGADPGTIDWIGNEQPPFTVAEGTVAGSDVELTISDPQINNAVYSNTNDGNKYYQLYGNIFNGSVRVTNSTSTDYQGVFLWALIPDGGSVAAKEIDIKVPAGSSIDIPLHVSGLDYGIDYYILKTSYVKGNSYSFIVSGIYQTNGAIMAYAADGKSTITIPSGTVFDASADAANALAIDVSGTGITSITPNALPNTLYIYSGTKPEGLDGKNVVCSDGGTYTAESITLTDGYSFFSPVDFTANSIELIYAFTTGADGTNGWNTIMLPFDVTSVTADGTPIDWFHSADDSGKNFWLKSFTGDGVNTVDFDFVSGTMQANTPYIVAFPGDRWGTYWDMSNKSIRFIGSGKVSKSNSLTSVTGDYYRFIGSTVENNTPNIYCLNDLGNGFELTNGSGPFRAYFKPGTFDRTVNFLTIGNGTPTGLTGHSLVNHQRCATDFYDLQGRRVLQPKKGLYIVNGKKKTVIGR